MIHRPKLISSTQGLGIDTKKNLRFLSDTLAIGTEIWSPLDTPWREGTTVIADDGYKWITRWEADKTFIITKFYDANSTLVGTYCDIARPITRTGDGFEFYDLYLDVWQLPGDDPVILDEDELDEALRSGYIDKTDYEAAQQATAEVLQLIRSGSSLLNF